MTSTNKNVGFIVALVCGLLGLLAFFAFPFVSYSGVSMTALTIATTEAQFSSGAGIFWIEAVLAGLITILAVLQFSVSARASGKMIVGGLLLGLGFTGVLLCVMFIILLIAASNSNSVVTNVGSGGYLSFLGLGFWAFFISVIGTVVGAVIAIIQAAQVVPGASLSSPYTQYPPNQQTPMQQYPPYQQPSSPQYPSYQQPSSPQYPSYQPPSSTYPPKDYPPPGRQ